MISSSMHVVDIFHAFSNLVGVSEPSWRSTCGVHFVQRTALLQRLRVFVKYLHHSVAPCVFWWHMGRVSDDVFEFLDDPASRFQQDLQDTFDMVSLWKYLLTSRITRLSERRILYAFVHAGGVGTCVSSVCSFPAWFGEFTLWWIVQSQKSSSVHCVSRSDESTDRVHHNSQHVTLFWERKSANTHKCSDHCPLTNLSKGTLATD